jgi:RHS repeat-associated protein
MPNSPVATPATPNKDLYNGGSEWQNDYSNLPDYYQTFNRNYDAAIARFVGVDPMAESAESMTSYQYAGNNPIAFNDPLGDKALACPKCSGGGGSGSLEDPGFFNPLGVSDAQTAADNALQAGIDYQNALAGYGGDGLPGSAAAAQILANNARNAGGVIAGQTFASSSQAFESAMATQSAAQANSCSTCGISYYRDKDGTISLLPNGGATNNYNIAVSNGNSDGTDESITFARINAGDWLYLTGFSPLSSANQGGDCCKTPYYDGLNKVNSVAGATTILGLTGASVGYLKAGSASLKWYSSGWTGGSRAFIKTAQLSKFFEALGRAGIVIGFAADTYELATGNLEGGWQHWATNTTMGIVGLTPIGFVTIPYFLIDAYYPGGFKAAMRDSAPLYNQMNQPNAAPPQVLMGMP